MATKLRNLKITAVALVDKGANQHAEVLLYKRAEPLDKMDTQGVPLTTQEILDHQAQCEAWRHLRHAFMDSLDSIMEYATPDEQGPLLLTTVEEFAASARQVLSTLGMNEETYKRAETGVVAVEKAGRVIAGQRLQRLKQAVMALQNIIMEAEPVTQKGAPMADKSIPLTVEDVTKRATDAEAQVTTLQAQVTTLEKRQGELEADIMRLTPIDIWKGVSAELRQRIEKAESEVRKRDCITQVQVYKALPVNPDDDWEVFDHVNTLLPEASRKRFYALLSAADEGMRQSALFKIQGANSTRTSNGGSAYAAIESQARELVTKGLAKTLEQGIDRVIQDNPDLYAQFEAERRGA